MKPIITRDRSLSNLNIPLLNRQIANQYGFPFKIKVSNNIVILFQKGIEHGSGTYFLIQWFIP